MLNNVAAGNGLLFSALLRQKWDKWSNISVQWCCQANLQKCGSLVVYTSKSKIVTLDHNVCTKKKPSISEGHFFVQREKKGSCSSSMRQCLRLGVSIKGTEHRCITTLFRFIYFCGTFEFGNHASSRHFAVLNSEWNALKFVFVAWFAAEKKWKSWFRTTFVNTFCTEGRFLCEYSGNGGQIPLPCFDQLFHTNSFVSSISRHVHRNQTAVHDQFHVRKSSKSWGGNRH